jgi:hypothetical protein
LALGVLRVESCIFRARPGNKNHRIDDFFKERMIRL